MSLRPAAAAWRRGDVDGAVAAAAAAGVIATAPQLLRIEALVTKTNGSRKVRLLEPAQVLDAIEAALADPHCIGVIHGGEATDGTQRTTLCLAFRDGAKLVVGVGLSAASSPGPGRTWKELQPWKSTRPADNVPRLRAWAARAETDRVALGVFAPATAPRTLDDEAALLAAVLADPDDDDPRAVYADRLIEIGDPRGQFIAIQLALAKARAGTERHAALSAESEALAKAHAARWSSALAQHTLKQYFRRGFVHAVEMRARAFVTHGARVFELAPIEVVHLRSLDEPTLRKIAQLPALAKVRRLVLERYDLSSSPLSASPHLGSLRSLDIAECHVDARGLEALLDAAPKLESIKLFRSKGLAEVARRRRVALEP